MDNESDMAHSIGDGARCFLMKIDGEYPQPAPSCGIAEKNAVTRTHFYACFEAAALLGYGMSIELVISHINSKYGKCVEKAIHEALFSWMAETKSFRSECG